MAQTVRDVMTTQPMHVKESASLIEAARAMRDRDIGDLIVVRGGEILGMVTDRDLVIRGLAEGHDPKTMTVGEICSTDVVTVEPGASVDRVIELMRAKAVRRIPVVDDGKPVGILSLGDLAMRKDKDSVLSDISEAPPQR
jgi:CBS domain-containing protein